MLINCPSCGQRISSKHKACPHCNYDVSGTGAGVPLPQAAGRVRQRRMANVRYQSYLAMMLVMLGLIGVWMETGSLMLPEATWSLFLFGAGALWYLITRIVWFWLRMQKG